MTFSYTDKELTLECSPEEQQELREIWTEGGSDGFTSQREAEFLEPLLANSELDWIQSGECGDLTDAPILGFRDWNNYSYAAHRYPVLQRWGFMPYAVRSFLTDLMENGKAVFVSSN